jgi:nucleotide-binding universal stress UspA family protein
MFNHILVPLDMSPLAEQMLPVTNLIAQGFHSTVVLFHAIEPLQERLPISADVFQPQEQLDILRVRVSTYMQRLERECLAREVKCERQISVGQPAHAILDFAECADLDLIAMTTHGRSGLQRWAHGSVAGKVLDHTRMPLLLVRAQPEMNSKPPRLSRILVPLDRSVFARQALPAAVALARTFDAELVLFHVWDYFGFDFEHANDEAIARIMRDTYGYAKRYMEEQTRKLHEEHLRVRWLIRAGPVANCIVQAVEQERANMIVMSSHGRSGLSRAALGSIADRVLRTSRIPVLLIHASEREPGAAQTAEPALVTA